MADKPAVNRKLKTTLEDIVATVRKAAPTIYEEAVAAAEGKGKPVPRKSDFDRFGIAVATREGEMAAAGNAAVAFPIQSISKVFALELALEAVGEKLWERVDREPTGDPFNSILDLEREKGIPRNPLVNAGALVICDVLAGLRSQAGPRGRVARLIERLLDGESVALETDVMHGGGGNLNRSMMFMAKHHGNFQHDVDKVIAAYAQQCAIQLDCRQLARAGRFLMRDAPERRQAADEGIAPDRRSRRILSIMMLCGLYDGSGDFAYRVGLPAKSGVGGGILAIAPHRASIAVWSPALDPMGNSWLGTLGLEELAKRTSWSVFG